jgi:CRISPR/Cas system-associated endoribonuclease Cas2
MLYVVSYDLMKSGQDYPRVIKRLEQWGGLRILYSVWLVRTVSTAVQLRDDLQSHIDANDRIFVANLTGESAWRSLIPSNETVKSFIEGA